MAHTRVVKIVNAKGLHARASAKLAALVQTFDAEVTVTRDNLTVSGASIMGLLLLAAAQGSDLNLSADGVDADAALDAVEDLIARRFDEAT